MYVHASLGAVTNAQQTFADMLHDLGCSLTSVPDIAGRRFGAVVFDDPEAGSQRTAEIMAALLALGRGFRRELRLGSWRGLRLSCGRELLFWTGFEIGRAQVH